MSSVSYLPGSSITEQQNEEDEARRQPILRELRDLILPAKEAWLKYTAGNSDGLKTLQNQLKKLVDRAAALENAPLNQLLGQIGYATAGLAANPGDMNESIAMEMATALLLAENSLERYQGVTDEFTRQSDVVCKRLQACLQGTLRELEVPEIELLDEISRKAQEKLLLTQVGQEILSNLLHIEQTLDAFFRDPTQREALPGLKPYLRQIYGALKILDLEPAVTLLDECERLVDEFCQPDFQADQARMELAAEGLSSLGFYVEAIQRESADANKIIISALAHLNPSYEAPSTDAQEDQTQSHAGHDEPDLSSIESGLGAQKEKALALLRTWQQSPADAGARLDFEKQISSLQQDADLVADETLKIQASQAKKLAEAGTPSTELAALVDQICAPKVAMEAPSESSAKLAQEEDETIDAEMLEIFLEEAGEVLDTIYENLGIVQATPNDKEALTSLRRSFHTLKGSGRMVGLWDLGEVAWGIEQVMNKWLQDEKNATPELLDVISRAHQSFAGWVEGLKERGSVHVDAVNLLSDAESLRTGIPQAEPASTEEDVAVTQIESVPDQVNLIEPELSASDVELQTAEAPLPVEESSVSTFEATTEPISIVSILDTQEEITPESPSVEEPSEIGSPTKMGGSVEEYVTEEALPEIVLAEESPADIETAAQLPILPKVSALDEIEPTQELAFLAEAADAITTTDNQSINTNFTVAETIQQQRRANGEYPDRGIA